MQTIEQSEAWEELCKKNKEMWEAAKERNEESIRKHYTRDNCLYCGYPKDFAGPCTACAEDTYFGHRD